MAIISQFKKGLGIAIATAAFSIGCGEIPNQNLSDFTKYEKSKPQLIITSNPVADGVVGENYFYSIETNISADCNLTKAPAEISIQDNILYGKLNHADNNIINIKCSAEDLKDANQEYELNVQPGKLRDISYDRIDYFSVPYTTFDGQEKTEDFAVVCETDFCPDLYQDDSYWNKRVKGIENSIKKLFEITHTSMLKEDELSPSYTNDYKLLISKIIKRPIEIHLSHDSSCNNDPNLSSSRGNLICEYMYDHINPPTSVYGFSNCLDPRYPEKCINPKTYIEPDKIEANALPVHEFNHSIDFMKATTNLSELISYPIDIILSHNNGNSPYMESFCDMNSVSAQGADYWAYSPFAELCKSTNGKFDIDKIKDLDNLISTDYKKFNYIDRTYYPTKELKCALDEVINDNTFDVFVARFCNNPNYKFSCNLTNPSSIFYIDPDKCAPRVLK